MSDSEATARAAIARAEKATEGPWYPSGPLWNDAGFVFAVSDDHFGGHFVWMPLGDAPCPACGTQGIEVETEGSDDERTADPPRYRRHEVCHHTHTWLCKCEECRKAECFEALAPREEQ